MAENKNFPKVVNEHLNTIELKFRLYKEFIDSREELRSNTVLKSYRKTCGICDREVINKEKIHIIPNKVKTNHMVILCDERYSMTPFTIRICERCEKRYFNNKKKIKNDKKTTKK